jgi:hypothetical protein
LKQSQLEKGTTSLTSCTARQQQEMKREILDNNVTDFDPFIGQLPKRYPWFVVKIDGEDVCMSLLNNAGSQVISFLLVQEDRIAVWFPVSHKC